MDREKVISWLEGLAEDDWRECYSDSEVQETARQALDLIDGLLKEQEVTQKDGYNLQELWKRARSGETLNETELNFLLADWDERNIFKQTVGSDQIT